MQSVEQQTMGLLVSIRDELAANTAKTDKLLRAFPGEDVDGHCRYHESVIEWRELRNKLVREALIKVAQAGALAAAGWILIALWNAFKITIKQ
jgi:hypothetical protein